MVMRPGDRFDATCSASPGTSRSGKFVSPNARPPKAKLQNSKLFGSTTIRPPNGGPGVNDQPRSPAPMTSNPCSGSTHESSRVEFLRPGSAGEAPALPGAPVCSQELLADLLYGDGGGVAAGAALGDHHRHGISRRRPRRHLRVHLVDGGEARRQTGEGYRGRQAADGDRG